MDQLKVRAVGGDEAGAVGARGERDEHVEMQVAQLVGSKSLVGVNPAEYLTLGLSDMGGANRPSVPFLIATFVLTVLVRVAVFYVERAKPGDNVHAVRAS